MENQAGEWFFADYLKTLTKSEFFSYSQIFVEFRFI